MAEFEVDPGELRRTARDLSEIAARLDSLCRRAAALAQMPMRQHFPELPRAQDAAAEWDEARTVFATGIGRVAGAVSRLDAGLERAAGGYESSDVDAVRRNEAVQNEQNP